MKWFDEDTQKTPTGVRAAAGFSDPWGVSEEWDEETEPAQVRVQTTVCTVTDYYSQNHMQLHVYYQNAIFTKSYIFQQECIVKKGKRKWFSSTSLRKSVSTI